MALSKKKLIPATLLAMVLATLAAPPLWWSDGDQPVINPNAVAENKAVANIGQAKHMAKSALTSLAQVRPDIAALIEADLAPIFPLTVPDPKPAGWSEKQKAPLLIGQLKAIADPFYSRLHAAVPSWLAAKRVLNQTNHPNSIFPWTATPDDDQNKALANLGQLKAAFSLRFEEIRDDLDDSVDSVDSDGDGLPDSWEVLYGLNPNDPADANSYIGNDGVTNLIKYKTGRNPLLPALPDTAGSLGFFVHTPLE